MLEAQQERNARGSRKQPSRVLVCICRYLRACFFLCNIRTLLMLSLACGAVYLCESHRINMQFDMEFSILAVGTVFPLVFSIQQAFSRREEALRDLAALKSTLMGIYFCVRDWDIVTGVPNTTDLRERPTLGDDRQERATHCAALIRRLLSKLRAWLSDDTSYESEAERRDLESGVAFFLLQLWRIFWFGKEGRRPQRQQTAERDDEHTKPLIKVYKTLNEINIHNENLMAFTGCVKSGEGGMGRLAAYVSRAAEMIERLRCLRDYRTPFLLRYVSFTMVLVSIVLASPYFAFKCVGSRWEKDTTGICPAGYFTAVLYVLVLSTLFHVQVALENPFDGVGVDDVFLELDDEFRETVIRFRPRRSAQV